MGHIDHRCYNIAHNLITNLFLPKYKQTITEYNIICINNLNDYISKEYNLIINPNSVNRKETDFTSNEQEMIISDSFDVLLMELEIYDYDEDVYTEFVSNVNWEQLKNIIIHYIHYQPITDLHP